MKFIVIFVLLVSSFISNAQGNTPTLPPQAKSHAVKFAPVPPANTNVSLAVMPYCQQNYFFIVNTGDTVSNVTYMILELYGGWVWGGAINTIEAGKTAMVIIPSVEGVNILVTANGKIFLGTC